LQYLRPAERGRDDPQHSSTIETVPQPGEAQADRWLAELSASTE
jgi:hypothetical protein